VNICVAKASITLLHLKTEQWLLRSDRIILVDILFSFVGRTKLAPSRSISSWVGWSEFRRFVEIPFCYSWEFCPRPFTTFWVPVHACADRRSDRQTDSKRRITRPLSVMIDRCPPICLRRGAIIRKETAWVTSYRWSHRLGISQASRPITHATIGWVITFSKMPAFSAYICSLNAPEFWFFYLSAVVHMLSQKQCFLVAQDRVCIHRFMLSFRPRAQLIRHFNCFFLIYTSMVRGFTYRMFQVIRLLVIYFSDQFQKKFRDCQKFENRRTTMTCRTTDRESINKNRCRLQAENCGSSVDMVTLLSVLPISYVDRHIATVGEANIESDRNNWTWCTNPRCQKVIHRRHRRMTGKTHQ